MTYLLCFHHAGGMPSAFLSWRNSHASNFDVVPVSLPTTRPLTGRRIYTSTGELIEQLVERYSSVFDEPYILYGHSMGGLLAYLMARRLTRSSSHTPPLALIVAASWSPRMRPSIDIDGVSDTTLIQELDRIGGIPEDLSSRPEWLVPMLPIIRDDLKMCSAYEHDYVDDQLDIPIHVVGAEHDRLVSREQTAGWIELGERVSVEYQPGGHFFSVAPESFRRRVFALAMEYVKRSQTARPE